MEKNIVDLFSPIIQAKPIFPYILERMGDTATMQMMLERFLLASSTSTIKPSELGAGTYTTGHTIYVDMDLMPGSGKPSEETVTRFITTIAHELSHQTADKGMIAHSQELLDILARAANPEAAAAAQLIQEGWAVFNEFKVAEELGTTMHSGAQLQGMLRDLGMRNGGFDSPAFYELAPKLAGDYIGNNLHPSTAPNLNYDQYYKYSWALAKCGVSFGQVDWTKATGDDFLYKSNDNGMCTLHGSIIPLKEGKGYLSIDAVLGSNGQIESESMCTMVNGAASQIDLWGPQSVVENDAEIFIHPLLDLSYSGYTTVIGSGNDIFTFDGVNVRFEGNRNNIWGANNTAVIGDGMENVIVQSGESMSVHINGHVELIEREVDKIDDLFNWFGYRPEHNPANDKEHRLDNWPGPNYRILPEDANGAVLQSLILDHNHSVAIQLVGVHALV